MQNLRRRSESCQRKTTMTNTPALALLRRLTHPSDLGHAVSAEVRMLAANLLHNEADPHAHWLYIAGPMTGLPDYNYDAFHAAQAELHRAGFVVMNPARNGLPMGLQWHQYMRRDLSMLIACNGIALLPGWERSRGARLEVAWADALQMPVRAVEDWIEEA